MDCWKAGGEATAERTTRVQEDPPSLRKLCADGARNDIARREFFSIDAGHEALASVIDEDGALAAHRLTDKRQRPAGKIEAGRMKLHELHVGKARACPCRQRKSLAEIAHGIGGGVIEPADAACRQHHPVGHDGGGLRSSRDGQTADRAVMGQQRAHLGCIEHRDRGRLGDRGKESGDDRGARSVS